MKIFLDDVRVCPHGYDIQVYTAQEAINLLQMGNVTFISLDHDLGPDEAGTGYDVAAYLEKAAYFKEIPKLHWAIHSANPVGIANMKRALENADRYWDSDSTYRHT